MMLPIKEITVIDFMFLLTNGKLYTQYNTSALLVLDMNVSI